MAEKKTIKKIETPIDGRETFVSLQKNFAEDGLPIDQKLNVLYELQLSDNEIEKIKHLRGDLPVEVAQIETERDSLKAKVARIEEMIAGFSDSIESYKQSIIDTDAQIEKYTLQLDNISNSREYDSIRKEVENLNLERQIAEKRIGDARMAIAERKEAIEAISTSIEICEGDLEAKQAELSTIIESTAAQEEALERKRNSLAAKIDSRTLSAYDRIRNSTRNHLAVVSVYNSDSCGGCFNMITPQRLVDIASGNKLVICEHCGRIIVNADAKTE